MILAILLAFLICGGFCAGEAFYERDWPRRTLPYLLALLFLTSCAYGQASRYDGTVYTVNQSAPLPGAMLPVLALSGATVQVCSTWNTSGCTALAVTYQSSTVSSGNQCPSNAQLYNALATSCSSTADVSGGWGIWAAAGPYAYFVTTSYGTYGPYPFSVDAGGSYCGLAGCTMTGPLKVEDPNGQVIDFFPDGRANVKAFGAKCDGVTDDSTAFQNAITYANAHGLAVEIPATTSGCVVTKSMNITAMGSLNLWGDSNKMNSTGKSLILDELTEAYPVLDFTGCAHCGVHHLSIIQQSGSLSTAEIFAAPTAAQAGANGGGNYFNEDDVNCVGGSATGACVVIYHSDQFYMTNRSWNDSFVGAGTVVGDTLGTATSVTSKFQTICTSCDSFTYAYFDPTTQTTTEGGAIVPLQITGSQSYLLNGYCTRGPSSSAGACVELSVNPSIIENNRLLTTQFRVEDQSGTSNPYCSIKYDDGAKLQSIKGAFLQTNTTAGSAAICGPASAEISTVDDNFVVSGGPAFNYLGGIDQGTIQVTTAYAGANSFGQIGSASGTGVMHNLNIYESEGISAVTDTPLTILTNIYGNATNAFFNSGGKICGPNPINNNQYCIYAQNIAVAPTNTIPSANTLSLPLGLSYQYYLNNGTTTNTYHFVWGPRPNQSSTSLVDVGVTNLDSGAAPLQLDLSNGWQQVLFPGGDVLNSSTAHVCYYDGAAYHNCPSTGGTASSTATLVSGTVTVSNAAACAVGSTCKYTLTHCGPNSSTAIGTLSTGTIVAGTSFVINALTSTNTVATGDLSTVCWRIN